tara:strand:+ start:461 stop:628 length:168 start_codon:yes stop_codon:yes gene_type:complete
MTYENWIEAVRQGYEDPCEYQHKERYCEECDIEESKTYFIDETCLCQDCYEESEE